MLSINMHEAKSQLSKLVERALAGEEIIIARAGQPLVRLMPILQDATPRVAGHMAGKIVLADDFDATPEEIIAAFTGQQG